ncbi:MAG: hypothetical protein ACE5DW_06680 [Thermodesulfobacteriota bacterium]
MSSLKAVEKRLLEDLFGMAGGYVLDFTNNTFAELLRETVAKDIYSKKYAFNGDSKAKRLRAFMEVESDLAVGKVLAEILDVWKYQNSQSDSMSRDPRYDACLAIVGRLLGKKVEEKEPEKQFLKQDFGSISLHKIPIDSSLLPILEGRLAEANKCFQSNSPLAVIFLCGSILEGLLLGVALQKPREFNQAPNSPKGISGKVKAFHKWSLAQFIDVACELGFLKLDVKKFSHELRDFRNYIHPYEQMASKFYPDQHTAEICLQVLKAAIASLSGERK